MDVLFLLIPMSVLLVFAIMGLFAWSLQAGQFDDLEREGERILGDHPEVDADQVCEPDGLRKSAAVIESRGEVR
ncbi:MAG TPA: cbb3-type cytochrome oxidase assembly protein CcoS [Albitalea sp.]|nr:cbb3-type cytochrome oxidase assembly protein CcoS [Albitalea sp.]HJW10271.1 cbb3-type cytochrome oxidase assembly protein CcoS [Albitalea sp.]